MRPLKTVLSCYAPCALVERMDLAKNKYSITSTSQLISNAVEYALDHIDDWAEVRPALDESGDTDNE